MACVCAVGLATWTHSVRPTVHTIRAGVDIFPPYAILNADGSFSGIALDVINEAARRGRMKIQWVRVNTVSPDQALLKNLVDIWPVLAETPERKRLIHITRPWLKNDYCLLTRNESRLDSATNMAGRMIAYPTYRMATKMAYKFLPLAILLPSKSPDDVIQRVCRGEADAGFLEARNLDPALMKRPPGCETTTFNVHFLPGAVSDAGIASTKQAAGAADELRSAITTMINDGSLSRIVDQWASFSASETRSLIALQQMERRVQFTLYGFLGLFVVAAILYWQYRLARKLRQAADRSKLLESDRNAVLEHLANTECLNSLLKGISEMAERQCPEIICTIAIRQGDSLVLVSSSSLPESLLHSMLRIEIAPSGVTSAVAAFEKKLTVSADLCSAPGWLSRRSQLQASGLQSCWAMPVRSGTGQVVAVVAAYLKRSSPPGEHQLRLLESAAQLTGVVLERRGLDQQLRHMATHDSLTGLPNRSLLADRLQQTLAKGQQFAVLCIDLDRFKQINDTLGHSIGDVFLRKVSDLIQGVLRQGDMLARMGGDEFTILLSEVASREAAEGIAQRLLEAIHTPLLVNGIHLVGTASIGISLYPEHGDSAEDLQRNADSAMYEAKRAGKNRYQVFAWEMSRAAGENLTMQHDIRIALENQQFELHYQPQFAANGQLVGAEALIRFRHPRFGMIPPGRFIPCAEESGLIAPIGQWVLRETCRQLAEWKRQGIEIVRTAINVSAIELAQTDFSDTVYSALHSHGLSPSLLEIELTESAVMGNIEESMSQMSQLKMLGIRLAIDDFGTGYSSLSYLQRLPVDAVKIDRSFIREDQRSGSALPLVRAIVAAARSLGLEVVAEGVETMNQHRAVCAAGCDIVQGFLLSKPLSASDMEALLRGNAKTMPPESLHVEIAIA